MEKPAKITLACLVGVAFIYAVGYEKGASEVQVVTKTVEKRVEVPGPTKTVTVTDTRTVPIPQPCLDAIDQLPRIAASNKIQSDAAGELLLALQEAGTEAFFKDIPKLNDLTEVVREQTSRINASATDSLLVMDTFDTFLKQCNTEIKEASAK